MPEGTSARPPLAGIRVLDFGHVLAGPFCTRLLADLGADVVRVESSRHPDAPWRSAVDADLDRDVSYLVISRSKRSVAIDLKTEQGRAVATRLAAAADVIAENFSAGVMERLGLGYWRLSALNSRVIVLSMSGYGHSGPRRDWTSMNTNLQAYSGLMMATGREGDPPTAISNSWMDYVGGLHAAFAVVVAVAERETTGSGRTIDLGQFEAGVATIGPLLFAAGVEHAAPRRLGNRSEEAVPQGCYRCAGDDEWCTVSVHTDEQWRALAGAIGRSAWADDPRFATREARSRAHDEIDRVISQWTRRLASADAEARLVAAGVPAARMRRVPDVLEAADRPDVFHREPDVVRSARATALPFTLAPSGLAPLRRGPKLGEHTAEVLSDWIALSAEEIAALKSARVLV